MASFDIEVVHASDDGTVSAAWPELTKGPSGTHKDFGGVSENLSTKVSAHSANPTGFFVEAIPQFLNPIRPRTGVYGKQVFAVSGPKPRHGRAKGKNARITGKFGAAVLLLSAYAYQKAFSLALAIQGSLAQRYVKRHGPAPSLPVSNPSRLIRRR